MRVTGHADDIEIVTDEHGFQMIVTTNVGEFQFRIQPIAEEVYREVERTIGAWLQEGEVVRSTHYPPVTEEDLDAYPLGSPKRITLEQEMSK